jgi:hypothetical protein
VLIDGLGGQLPRDLGRGGMSHSLMRREPALPIAIATTTRITIQRAPSQVINLGSPKVGIPSNCRGRAGRVNPLTGIEGSGRPVRRIVLLDG